MIAQNLMNPQPLTLRPTDTVATGADYILKHRLRHVPVVDDQGLPVGMITTRDLVDFLVELCPEEILNLPPEPQLAFHPEREGA
jgi:CBS domain-containing protein